MISKALYDFYLQIPQALYDFKDDNKSLPHLCMELLYQSSSIKDFLCTSN